MSEECKAVHPDSISVPTPMPPVMVVKLRALPADEPLPNVPADPVVIVQGIPGASVNLSHHGLPYVLEFVNVRPLRASEVTLS